MYKVVTTRMVHVHKITLVDFKIDMFRSRGIAAHCPHMERQPECPSRHPLANGKNISLGISP